MGITCKQIAEMVGVSRQAAASVLNHAPKCLVSKEKKEQILKLARELNYIHNNAARTLCRGKSGLIGILTGGLHIKRTGYALINIDKELRANGFLPVIIYTRSEKSSISAGIHSLLQQNVDGLIINGIPPGTEIISEFKQQGLLDLVPTVIVNSEHCFQTNSVRYQYDDAVDLICKRAAQRDFKQIVPVMREPENYIWEAGCAIRKLLGKLNVPAEPTVKIGVTSPLSADRFNVDIMQEVRAALRHYRPGTLYLCDTGLGAIQITSALLQKFGKFPEDSAVIAFDLTEYCSFFFPGITAVELNFDLLARKCCELLKNSIKSHGKSCDNVDIQADLVMRETF